MSAIRNATKKDLWKDFSPFERLMCFHHGKEFTSDVESYNTDAYKLAWLTSTLCNYANKIPKAKQARAARLSEWDSKNFAELSDEVMNLIFDCHMIGNGKRLHALADAITLVHKKGCSPVDPERAWLNCYLYEFELTHPGAENNAPKKKFSEIRAAFYAQFPEHGIEDSTLRTMIKKEMGYQYAPEKKGPTGPRIR